ncbi:MAG: hypothetical protein QF907_07525 [Nitrospinota bacterium]|mgnify:CR=1 FL=1|nr:hypothetical protein [Nitrospinota bacterium]
MPHFRFLFVGRCVEKEFANAHDTAFLEIFLQQRKDLLELRVLGIVLCRNILASNVDCVQVGLSTKRMDLIRLCCQGKYKLVKEKVTGVYQMAVILIMKMVQSQTPR